MKHFTKTAEGGKKIFSSKHKFKALNSRYVKAIDHKQSLLPEQQGRYFNTVPASLEVGV